MVSIKIYPYPRILTWVELGGTLFGLEKKDEEPTLTPLSGGSSSHLLNDHPLSKTPHGPSRGVGP